MKCEFHNYIAGKCFVCGHIQQVIKFEREVLPKKKNINSEFQYNVDKVITFFGEDVYAKGVFAKYARVYKVLGKDRIYEFMSYCRERKIHNPAYFFGMVKRVYNQFNLKR